MFEATGVIVWAAIALVVAIVIVRTMIELVRRWFVKAEYPCDACGSRFTTLHGKWMGIDTGTFYSVHCLACGHRSTYSHPYHRGTGRQCGEGVSGWQRRSLASMLAENAKYRQGCKA